MIGYLSTHFNEDEKRTIELFTQQYGIEISICYAVDMDRLRGIDNPNRMIYVGGYFLCEEKDEPLSWYMGQKVKGQYDFWGNYGDLHNALEGL